MTQIGSVIDGKYEILKEIGRGGMSVVYLAMDKRLNKQWAVKEIRKKGSGKNDEIVVNSLLTEANLMKRLDHPSLPRIVDIIDNGITIYIVMDYIEGESLDKILKEYGAQPEELVIGWAKQLCDALGYLHSQKPPVIYRDKKPANVMLKPEGNIKIIDFGIAREYKELSLADTTVLGTKGYAPPEQYSGQTDPRSDIFALGMTMHHLLTGVDPRSGEAYAPVRQWNPDLSEGIELIIDRCVEPAPENRYQSCTDLLYDLEHPELITKGFKKKQKRKLWSFLVSAGLCVAAAIAGLIMNAEAVRINNRDYDANINSADPSRYYDAIELYPERIEAYNRLITYCEEHEVTKEDIIRVGNVIDKNDDKLDHSDPKVADLFYDMGMLYFSSFDGTMKDRATDSNIFFEKAVESEAVFAKKDIAECYSKLCKFIKDQGHATKEPSTKEGFAALFREIRSGMRIVGNLTDEYAHYDQISFYYSAMVLIHDQAASLATAGYDRSEVLKLFEDLKVNAVNIHSTNNYVTTLQGKIKQNYDTYLNSINREYDSTEKWGNEDG